MIRVKGFSIGASIALALWSTLALATPTHAELLHVTAAVQAPLPTGPAVITYPINQQQFATNTTFVKGTCATNTAYVVIDRNNTMAGTATCISGQFSLEISLITGTNVLIARSFSSTDGEGPASASVTIYYLLPTRPSPEVPPVTPPQLPPLPTLSAPSQLSEGTEAFFITLEPHYKIQHVTGSWAWDITFHGGVPPYSLTIDWGDGTSSTYTADPSTTRTIEHSYKKEGLFVPTARASDSSGKNTQLQFFAIAKNFAISPIYYPFYTLLIILLLLFILLLCALFDIELLIGSTIQLLQRLRRKKNQQK